MRLAIPVIVLFCLASAQARAEWKLDRFLISTWGSPEDEASAQAYADARFNVVMCNADRLDLCRKHGLQAIVMDAGAEKVPQLLRHPAVWGWYVRDEPKAEQFEEVGKAVAAFHEADLDHPAYVNLMAWMDLKQYLATVRPRFLSYDYYQWWWGTKNHFWRLEEHRRAALEANLPLFCWVEANADPRWEWGKPGATTLPDNAVKLRQSVYTALAYGVKGIQWFNASLVFTKPEQPGQAPKLTQSGEDIKRLNTELEALGPVLIRLRSVDVFHTEPVPEHTRPVPADPWVQAVGGQLTVGLFEGASAGKHLMVVNRDVERARTAELRFARGIRRVQRLDVQRRRWVRVSLTRERDGGRKAMLQIAPGDGGLLQAR